MEGSTPTEKGDRAVLHLLFIAEQSQSIDRLRAELQQKGLSCTLIPPRNNIAGQIATQSPDLVLLQMNGSSPSQQLTRRERKPPVIALIGKEALGNSRIDLKTVDDFVVAPGDADELLLRAKRLLDHPEEEPEGEVVRCGDLAINLATCEVSLNGQLIDLTFKEYELLRFLASHPGRVYTRDSLLNQVWGYDYFGGDRTVDVHIRRLRSKVEDLNHSFIETVRNIGYRFRCESR
jgi:DNA-binding response OmpR family regulator